MNIRTGRLESWKEVGYLLKEKEKQHCQLHASHHLSCIPWNSPEALLSLFPTTSITWNQRSHLSIPSDGAHTFVPSLKSLEQIWVGICCVKIKAGQWSLSDHTSHPFYLKQKASSVQSVMNYFFGFGLTTCVRSVENPSSIKSWVKVLCALILYVLCISSVTSMML